MDIVKVIEQVRKDNSFRFSVSHISSNSILSFKFTAKFLPLFPNLVRCDIPIFIEDINDWKVLGSSGLDTYLVSTDELFKLDFEEFLLARYYRKKNLKFHLRVFSNSFIFEYLNKENEYKIYIYNSYLIEEINEIVNLFFEYGILSDIYLCKGIDINLLESISHFGQNLLNTITIVIDPKRKDDYDAIFEVMKLGNVQSTFIYTDYDSIEELYSSSKIITQILSNYEFSSIYSVLAGDVEFTTLYYLALKVKIFVLEGTKRNNENGLIIVKPEDYHKIKIQLYNMDKPFFDLPYDFFKNCLNVPIKSLLYIVKKGTVLYHGSFYKFNNDNAELSLRYKGDVPIDINTYRGTWFSISPNFALGYAIGKVIYKIVNKPETEINIDAIEPNFTSYIVERDIPMLINFTDQLCEYTLNISYLLNELTKLGNVKVNCDQPTLKVLSDEIYKGSFIDTNYYFAALLSNCVEGINGWIHLNDSHEIFLVDPSKWLRKEDTYKILYVTINDKLYKFDSKENISKTIEQIKEIKPDIGVHLPEDIIQSVTFNKVFPGQIEDVSEEYIKNHIVPMNL